jgi:hypothetical protein
MSDAEKPKRKVWQFHLSTAVLTMLISSGMLWANLRERHEVEWGKSYGWPNDAVWIWSASEVREFNSTAEAVESNLRIDEKPIMFGWNLFINFGVGVGLLGMSSVSIEFLIRRREGHSP